jgi:predicted RNA-binding protein with PUA-like domain
MKYWLIKTEPQVYSIKDLERDKRTWWTEVRNYQARNYLKEMRVKDQVLVYHSNSQPSAVVGIAEVSKLAEADATQFDRSSEVYDPKASEETPRWFCPEIRFVSGGKREVSLQELRERRELKDMILLQRGSRLSVQPVSRHEFECIRELLMRCGASKEIRC